MPLKTMSFLNAAANAVFTSLKVKFGEQARVLLFTGYERTKSHPIFKAGRVVKLPDKELRFFVSDERCSSLNNSEL
jgi:hypothetical protein